VSARLSVLVYNTTDLKPNQLPSSVLGLAAPRWKGKVAYAPSESDFQPLVTAVAKLEGTATAEAWLRGLQANARDLPDNEAVTSQVSAGQSELAPLDDFGRPNLGAKPVARAFTPRCTSSPPTTPATCLTYPARPSCARAPTGPPPRSSSRS
jgi:ABC-type Fe3+ transport system substrate-binding protein